MHAIQKNILAHLYHHNNLNLILHDLELDTFSIIYIFVHFFIAAFLIVYCYLPDDLSLHQVESTC